MELELGRDVDDGILVVCRTLGSRSWVGDEETANHATDENHSFPKRAEMLDDDQQRRGSGHDSRLRRLLDGKLPFSCAPRTPPRPTSTSHS